MGREQGTSNQTAQQATAKLAQAPSTSERGLSTGQPQFPSFSQHVHLLGSLPDALPLPYALASAHTVTSAGNVPSATFTFSSPYYPRPCPGAIFPPVSTASL